MFEAIRVRVQGKKFLFLTGIAVFLLLAMGWGLVLASAPTMIKHLPEGGSILPSSTPTVSVNWVGAPGAQIKSAEVFLDGSDISDQVVLAYRGFKYYPKKDLPEGKHRIRAVLKYGFLFPRKVELNWSFVTDTTPPELEFRHGTNSVIATSNPNYDLAGTTEPRSIIKAKLNNKSISVPSISADGSFVLRMDSLRPTNKLRLEVADQAGNITTLTLPLVLDRKAPLIEGLTPADGSVVHTNNPFFSIDLKEQESEVSSFDLTIDGIKVEPSYSTHDQQLSYQTRFLSDGDHKATIKAVDAAGNVTERTWAFKVDSTKLVVDLSERKLYLHKGGKVVKTYPVAIGTPGYPTPKGNWRVVQKRYKPTWYNPHAEWSHNMPETIPPGPNNPLGLRALNLNASGIRIHGTSNIASIGTPASHGCVRMFNSDVIGLYELVEVGTPVDVVE